MGLTPRGAARPSEASVPPAGLPARRAAAAILFAVLEQNRPLDDGALLNERSGYAARYDHAAMGWRVGGAMDVTFGRMLVGVALDLRDLYGLDTELRRTTVMGASIRVGADFLL